MNLIPFAKVVWPARSPEGVRRGFFLRLALVALALLPVMALLFLELLGARGDVGFLSGTRPAHGDGQLLSGGCYAVSWFTAVIVSPIALLAVGLELGLQWAWRRYTSRR